MNGKTVPASLLCLLLMSGCGTTSPRCDVAALKDRAVPAECFVPKALSSSEELTSLSDLPKRMPAASVYTELEKRALRAHRSNDDDPTDYIAALVRSGEPAEPYLRKLVLNEPELLGYIAVEIQTHSDYGLLLALNLEDLWAGLDAEMHKHFIISLKWEAEFHRNEFLRAYPRLRPAAQAFARKYGLAPESKSASKP